jgi:hypothetical protein
MKMPRVSIITALYNKEPYVAETVRSVLKQTVSDWELIVVDNGSTDNGPAIVRQFADLRIRLVASPRQGPGAARNFGLRLATGEWILFLDADDLIEMDYLEERLELLKQQPQAGLLVGCWKEFRDDSRTHLFRRPAAAGQATKALEQTAIAFAPWALHAALVRRARLITDLHWPEHLDGYPSEDAAFWFPVILDASVAWSARAGALYRVQTASSRNEIGDAEQWTRAVTEVIKHNVAFLTARGRCPDAEQCANIVRVLESTYRVALGKQNRAAARLALAQAKVWLKASPTASLSIAGRKLLGLRLFNLLRFGTI